MQGRIVPIPYPSKHPKKSPEILDTPKDKQLFLTQLSRAEPCKEVVLRLTEISQPQNLHTLSTIRPTQINNTEKNKYIIHWTNTIKNQHKLECYSPLNQEYTMANYLTTVTDVKTLTMYRLSEHSLAVETGRRRQIWLSCVEIICSHCSLGEIETELHFLTDCQKCQKTRDHFYPNINHIFLQFNICSTF